MNEWLDSLVRMELADLGNPEALAAKVIELIPNVPLPIPIDDIARKLNVSEIRYEETNAFEGCLICLPGKTHGGIIINSRQRPTRRRFTLGHELGHWLIPSHTMARQKFVCSTRDFSANSDGPDKSQRMEWEANRFAAHLLIPTALLSRTLDRIRHFDLTNLLGIADKFGTSKEFTAIRFVEVSDEPACIVTSQNGTIRRVYKQKSFPRISVWGGDAVPNRSRTSTYSGGAGSVSDLDEVDTGQWLDTAFGSRSPSLFEQVHIQEDGHRLTFLTIDSD